MSSRELPLEATTPVTEAIENVVGEGVRGVTDVSYHAQQVISRATTGGPFAAYVADVSRLGVAVLRAAVSSWSAAIDGLGLIAADQVEWWWTQELTLTFPANQNGQPTDVRGVARAEVLSVPHKRKVAERLVRVAHRSAADGTPGFIDRGAGVPADWDRTCYVSVRQHADFIPSAVVVTVTMRDAAGGTLATSEPIDGILSLP